MEKRKDVIEVQPLTAWEVGVDAERQLVTLQLHCLAQGRRTVHPRAVASRADALRLATVLLQALQKLDAQQRQDDPPALALDGLAGSPRPAGTARREAPARHRRI